MEIKPVFLLLSALLFIVAYKSSEKPLEKWSRHNDFAHYYLGAEIFSQGRSPYSVELKELYKLKGLINKPPIEKATNPPALLLLTSPLALLEIDDAFMVWSAVQFLSLLAMIIFSIRALGILMTKRELLIITLASLAVYPVTYHFELGQTQLLIGALIAIALKLMLSDLKAERIMGALLIGFATSIKLFTWPLLVLVAIELGTVGLIASVAALILPNLLASVLVGPELITDFISEALPYVSKTVLIFAGSSSLIGTIIHSLSIISADTYQITEQTVRLLNILSASFLFILSVVIARLKRDLLSKASMLIALLLILSPTTWSHYLVLTIIPFMTLIKLFRERATNSFWLILCYVAIAFSQGRLRRGDNLWQWVTACWGVFALSLLFGLLLWTSHEPNQKQRIN